MNYIFWCVSIDNAAAHIHTITHSIVAHGMRPHLIKAALCAQIPVVAGFSPTYATTKYSSDWLKAQRGRWRDTEGEWEWEEGEAQNILALHRTHPNLNTRLDWQYAGVSRDGYIPVSKQQIHPWHCSPSRLEKTAGLLLLLLSEYVSIFLKKCFVAIEKVVTITQIFAKVLCFIPQGQGEAL